MTPNFSTLQAYHNKKSIKTKYVNRMKDHIKKDELVHGDGWTGQKGCAVGCTLNRYDHVCYQNELGLPEWLARLEDSIFEGMSLEKSKTFPLLMLQAIPIGANLDVIYHKMQIFILELAKQNVKAEYDYVIKVIDGVIDYHLKRATGFFKTESAARSAAWSAAESAAWSAAESAESAAWSAESAARSAAESAESAARSAAESAESAARSAAWSAAESAESAAESAARSAAWSAARSAAWSAAESAAESAAYDKMADKLLELLKEA